MTSTIAERVHVIAADLFHLAPEQVTGQLSPEQIEGWDSVQHLNLILAVESEFDLVFEPEEIDQMKTLGEISAVIAVRFDRQSR